MIILSKQRTKLGTWRARCLDQKVAEDAARTAHAKVIAIRVPRFATICEA